MMIVVRTSGVEKDVLEAVKAKRKEVVEEFIGPIPAKVTLSHTRRWELSSSLEKELRWHWPRCRREAYPEERRDRSNQR